MTGLYGRSEKEAKGNALESKHVEVFKLKMLLLLLVVLVLVLVLVLLLLLLLLLFSQHIPSPKVKSWLVRSTL